MVFKPNAYPIPQNQRNLYIPPPSMARTKVVRQFKKRYNPYASPSGGGSRKIPRVAAPLLTDAEMNAAYDAAMAAAAAANRASANVRQGGFIDKEVKFLDTAKTVTAIPATVTSAEMPPTSGCTGCISAPAQGDGPSNRDGKKCLITNVLVNGQVTRAGGADQADVPIGISYHVALVLDRQSNGATLNSEDVYQAAGSGQTTLALRNLQYSKRFQVLAVHKGYLASPMVGTDGSFTNSSGGQEENFVLQKGLNLPVTFTTGTTADIANVIDNSLHVIAFADTSSTAPNQLSLAYDARIRFVG